MKAGRALVLLATAALMLVRQVLVAVATPAVNYRVQRRFDLRSPSFLHVLSSALSASVTAGNLIEPLDEGVRFYPAMLEAIRQARRSVCLECYFVRPGRVVDGFVAALAERAQAGVRVRVILDAIGARGFDVARFERAGCDVVQHPRHRWGRGHRIVNSTHREVLIVDGRTAFTGGAGLADTWVPGHHGPAWHDRMVRVRGPAVAALAALFAEHWLEGRGEILVGEDIFPAHAASGPHRAVVVKHSPGLLLSRALIQLLIESASREVRLATPYFLPDPSLLDALIAAARRGVAVSLLLPGRPMDHAWVRLTSRRLFGALLESGVRIFEYDPAMLHQKLLVVDRLWSVLGSMNADRLSFEYLDEITLAVVDEPLAAVLAERHEQDLRQAREVTLARWRRRSWRERAAAGTIWAVAGQDWADRIGRRGRPPASRRY